MKKNISDLLDGLGYNPLNIKTDNNISKQNERVKALTMKKIMNQTENTDIAQAKAVIAFKKRRFLNTMAAVFAVTILCGVVYASDGFGVKEKFNSFYGGDGETTIPDITNLIETHPVVTETTESTQNKIVPFAYSEHFRETFGCSVTEMSKEDVKILENLGTNGMQSVTSNGTVITPTAAVFDSHIGREPFTSDYFDSATNEYERNADYYYIVLDITASEGTVLDLATYTENEEEAELLHPSWSVCGNTGETFYNFPTNNSWSGGTMYYDETPGDNNLKIILQFYINPGDPSFGNGTEKPFMIYGLWQQSRDKEQCTILDGKWTFDLEKFGNITKSPETSTPVETNKTVKVDNPTIGSYTFNDMVADKSEKLYSEEDLTPEQAAAICAQKTAEIYSINIPDGTEIDLYYAVGVSPDSEGNQWSCFLYTDKDNLETISVYNMSIDSVTGEVYTTSFSYWGNAADMYIYTSPEEKAAETLKAQQGGIDERSLNLKYAEAAEDFVRKSGYNPVSSLTNVSGVPTKGGDEETYNLNFNVEVYCEGGGYWIVNVDINTFSIYSSFYHPNGIDE